MSSESVSLCVVADTHRKHREITIPPCDILIHCGDFCSFRQNDLQTLKDADAWFSKSPVRHVLCVAGNHDFLVQSQEFKFHHAQVLEDNGVEICGLTFYGSPWCPDLAGFAYYASPDELVDHWKRIPSGIDVLITHTPPNGSLDLPKSGISHVGCAYLREELKRIRPRVHVFGHIHASHGTLKTEGTQFINASVVAGPDFSMCHTPTMINLEPKPTQ